ncbi:MAG TPA: NAD(P)-dependent oxidoreductase [Flavobacteriales bacterium]|nr:NAD(P)-dependent oxidoreductase [Flavobacteriales bacterium]HPH81581.1 NAD(P)-dependent oxidoreductase [Flavobacteriales bacterium]
MARLLITGGSGFIGRYFVERFKDREIVNLDLRAPDYTSHARYHAGDIRNLNDVRNALQGVDMIIHLAAMHHDFGIADEAYFDTNVRGAEVLISEAEKAGVNTIINFSSVAVYGGKGNPGPTNESTEPAPTNPYGVSKLEAEARFSKWANAAPGRKLIIVRSTVVFGPHNLANVLNLIKAIDEGLYFHVGKSNNIKSLAYVENIVDASLFALNKLNEGICLFNYVDEPQLSSREIANMQARFLGKKIRMILPRWMAMILAFPFDVAIKLSGKNLKISSKRVAKLITQTNHGADYIRELGFKPKYSIEFGMEKMIRWYKSTKKNR